MTGDAKIIKSENHAYLSTATQRLMSLADVWQVNSVAAQKVGLYCLSDSKSIMAYTSRLQPSQIYNTDDYAFPFSDTIRVILATQI